MEKPPVTKFYAKPRDAHGFDVCCDQPRLIEQQNAAEPADIPSMVPGSKPLPDVTRDGGDFLPGTGWPVEQTPEPPGTFNQDMHTRWTQEAWDAYYARWGRPAWQPTADEIEAQTAANTWRAEHEHDVAPTGIDATLAERGARYGSFTEHSRLAQGIKAVMVTGRRWAELADDQKEALEMVAHKIGRILNGDPDYIDSWHDIIGYVKLIEDRLNGVVR